MKFHCFACKNRFEASHFNVARINISCPICNTELNMAQSLGRVYGEIAGKQISEIMEALQRVCDRSRNALLAPVVDATYFKISKICEEARA